MSILKEKLLPFTDSVKISIDSRNYYAALTVCMTLPDICSKLEYPEEKNTGKRYSGWFEEYVSHKYKSSVGLEKDEYVFLSGSDFYALRCSFLHQGETEIIKQRAREVLENFVFLEPIKEWHIHNNKINNKLQLQIDVFCEEIMEGVNHWILDNEKDVAVNDRSRNLISIQTDMNF